MKLITALLASQTVTVAILFVLLRGCVDSATPEERYFLVSYSAASENQQVRACIWFKMKSFPSKEWIKMRALSGDKLKKYRPEHVVIENIFEFRNKQDYDAFLYTKYNFEKDFDEINRETDSAIQSTEKWKWGKTNDEGFAEHIK